MSSQDSSSVPKPALGADAGDLDVVRHELLVERGGGLAGNGRWCSDLPLVRVPLAGVLPVLDANVTVLILCALASAMNCE